MKQDCLDIGIVQAFMDGELDHGQSARVSGHIAVCDACAIMLAEAEDESAIVFPALEREFDSLVPTQRLWAKINDSIVEERENRPFWEKAWAFLRIALLTPSLAAAAVLILVIGVGVLVMVNRKTAIVDGPVVAGIEQPKTVAVTKPENVNTDQPEVPIRAASKAVNTAPSFERADYRPQARREINPVRDSAVSQPNDTANGFMPGEESYVKTIASLSQSVNGQKDNAMRGSERVSFERDLAVVDDAIKQMRTEVKKNPKNESAKQMLYSSYQNKIDLLSSVSQKEELVASLR